MTGGNESEGMELKRAQGYRGIPTLVQVEGVAITRGLLL